MFRRTIGLAVGVAAALGVAGLCAQEAECPAFQASLVPGHALHGRDRRIEGLTLSVWGENPQSALALGLVNGSVGDSAGLSVGLVNYAESYRGAHWSFVNLASGDVTGWQGGPVFGLLVSALNYTGGQMTGLQTGLVNLSGSLNGVQIGLVNYTQRAEAGVQVGVVNVIAQNRGWFARLPDEVAPAMVLVNWRF